MRGGTRRKIAAPAEAVSVVRLLRVAADRSILPASLLLSQAARRSSITLAGQPEDEQPVVVLGGQQC